MSIIDECQKKTPTQTQLLLTKLQVYLHKLKGFPGPGTGISPYRMQGQGGVCSLVGVF